MCTSSVLSPSIFMAFFVAVGCFMAYPEVVTAKQAGITRHYTFNTKLKNITRLCQTKSIVTVNGKFPGPRVVAREGDGLVVKVVNHVPNNISIHWHGIRQLRSGWADGPSYITQCPIQTAIINQSLQTGGGPNVSDAYTFNGLPGPLYNCSAKANFASKFRSLATTMFPANVPQTVDKKFYFTVGLGTNPCPKNQTCQGPNGTKFAASMNNISFALPTTALLQSYFFSQSNGVYTTDFPAFPLHQVNYTGTPPNNTLVSNGTKLVVIPFNTRVEVVLQDTSILGAESHPLHFHGYNFYVVGQGFGNFDPENDPPKFNLVDPVERNTIGVPSGGWVAIRFQADNPGVWLMHCHFDVHLSWGLRMAWIVLDGKLPNQKLPPPPSDLPKC
ncbi:hypothetical protein V6N13_039527 [Hibiscus sabdariffa]|uniref:Laccase n=1 Tax=Hibiscus sabdariffa TaxID=183260 RepID=A0ABR2SVL8_9ROSI